MALDLVGHICKICGSAWQTRQKAKKHVMRRHLERVHHRHGPGQHVEYLWLEMRNYGQAPYKSNGSEED